MKREVVAFAEGGYRYLKAGFQFCSGVAAEPGFGIERVRFTRPLPVADGFAAVEKYLNAIGRPTVALCGMELRSNTPFTAETFQQFNLHYVTFLERFGLYRDSVNPVARTNVCPAYDPPPVPSIYAFSHTVAAKEGTPRSFVSAGAGELRRDAVRPEERIVARGDTSPAGMRQKVRHVMEELEQRLAALGFTWKDALETQAYTVYEIGPLIEEEIVRRGATPGGGGLTWHFCRPPVVGTDFEMDVRSTLAVRKLEV
jgi:hypothetical protein